jgi:prepilin-type N-terminal cleavage/methylation domain-containing protein
MSITTNFLLPREKQNGFTLVEIAIVLMIVSILLAALVPTLSGQMEQRSRSETRKKLEEVKEALIGYAVVNGRLPCPASSTSNGIEAPVGGGACTAQFNGLVPATTLGLSGLNPQGYIVDGWNNPIRYAVTDWSSNALTTTNGMSNAGLTAISANLHVCNTAAGSTGTACAAGSYLTPSGNGVPVVIYSAGPNGGNAATAADEMENSDNDKIFVSHDNAPDYDDLVIWLSLNTLLNRMVAAGKLP